LSPTAPDDHSDGERKAEAEEDLSRGRRILRVVRLWPWAHLDAFGAVVRRPASCRSICHLARTDVLFEFDGVLERDHADAVRKIDACCAANCGWVEGGSAESSPSPFVVHLRP
jgi:hypothetical protein